MRKVNYKNILLLVAGLLFIMTANGFAAKEGKKPAKDDQQFGEVQGTKKIVEGEVGPVKENICKNPKLCESLEIDLMDSLQKAKIPVMLQEPKASASTENYMIALNLGAVVSDGLSAMINKNKAALLKVVGILKEDGKKLGVSEELLTKFSKQLTDLANKGQWKEVGPALYEFKDHMDAELVNKNMKDEATLSMVSGTLEGLYILAKSMDKKFSTKDACLLQSKSLAKYLEKYMNTLSEGVKGKSEIKAIQAALPKIDKIASKKTSCTRQDTKDLIKILEPLHKAMQ